METSPEKKTVRKLGVYELALAGIFGALAIALAFTPLGMIPVPNPTGAATTLHLPAVISAVLGGPIVGAFVGLVLSVSSWILYGSAFIGYSNGNLIVALAAVFIPRLFIGPAAYYAYRLLRKIPVLAAALAGLAGTLANTVGVLGILIVFGTFPFNLLGPVFAMNVPIEMAVALIVTIPVTAALRSRGRIAAERN
jgi:uncharacterized membrane protein